MRLVDERMHGPTMEIGDMRPKELPLRELPPGNRASLYLQYISFMRVNGASADKPASRATFYAVAKEWEGCLKFRRPSDHTLCLVCSRLKVAIHESKDASQSQRFIQCC